MKKNVVSLDKVIRILIAAGIVVLFLMNVISGTVGIVLFVVAGVLVLTSLLGFCPLYWLLGISTLKKKK